jgi:high-affinity iron transporter
MLFSFLVTVREGVEMALIITILLGYLRSIDQKQYFRQIWYGVGAAAALSIAFGGSLELASRELDGRVLEAFEGFTMLFAVIVLTWMLFWMRKQTAGISRDLKYRVDRALSRGSVAALVLLAFSSVGREGFETALFLFAGSTNQGSDVNFALGGILGFLLAGAVGVVLYYGAARLPLRQFFLASGVVLMLIAAGMLSNAVTELHEATILKDIGTRPWDTESYISMTSDLGKFLHTVLGYDSAPSTLQIGLYWSYLGAVVTAYVAWPLLRLPAWRRRASAEAATATITTDF